MPRSIQEAWQFEQKCLKRQLAFPPPNVQEFLQSNWDRLDRIDLSTWTKIDPSSFSAAAAASAAASSSSPSRPFFISIEYLRDRFATIKRNLEQEFKASPLQTPTCRIQVPTFDVKISLQSFFTLTPSDSSRTVLSYLRQAILNDQKDILTIVVMNRLPPIPLLIQTTHSFLRALENRSIHHLRISSYLTVQSKPLNFIRFSESPPLTLRLSEPIVYFATHTTLETRPFRHLRSGWSTSHTLVFITRTNLPNFVSSWASPTKFKILFSTVSLSDIQL